MPTQAPTKFPTCALPQPGSPIEPIAQGIVCGPEVTLTRRLIEKADGSVDIAFVPLTEEDQQDKRTRERLERQLRPQTARRHATARASIAWRRTIVSAWRAQGIVALAVTRIRD